MKKQMLTFLASMTLASCAMAQVTVKDAWIRATVPTAKATGAFMQLQSARDARLVEVRSSAAGVVEIHEMAMEGQMMRMHAVAGLDLPAGKAVNLASGSYHVMLLDLKRQLKEGDTVPMTLVIQNQDKKTETVSLSVPVKALNYAAPKH
ncbi:copper chaperone PCu(A)C [Rugamonas apoptosis]|uniref:Copper chaperone PCu(A)C n=1 Tax=Rugamonas apoptosis TaxID=2758570 RepID=A0A7W2IJS1_9BURK|nr:copper chaperone PCu(A)C [Rugamonas apoptosis]MBA5686809.1 copper chaperone PCu(A)C [Rugamonas apoptosis]